MSWVVCMLLMNLYYTKILDDTKRKISEQYKIEIEDLIKTIHNQITVSEEVEQKLNKMIQFSEIINDSRRGKQLNNNSNNIEENNNM